tara:strand:- start:1951 stop:2298 length:348 start_codon:yes stop_codon:yes gene_type:complete
MTAKEILETALEIVEGDRSSTHGEIRENHTNIARLWNAYLSSCLGELKASDVANMMELLKIARRRTGSLNRDDYVDGAGYAATAYECAEETEELLKIARRHQTEEIARSTGPVNK